ncbi:hypothetical protein QRX50_03785 [Amycolatopsis carbonis]|uniref:Uncharacterized protein n=1 Tax=Amycolatopsis carbonis TaxID=715471 RepID=A0A9Y2IKD2_9PSEU|nr:hypothetical protein [Amycolatopsis sp. 2-15]WIX79933.1 hypothetical protein QRX50_03785 [Amycolatopsis sp. 2-15]
MNLDNSLHLDGARAACEVSTNVELYRDRLVHLGFDPAGTDCFVRWLSATGGVRRTHANFARHLEEMLLQSARRARCRGRTRWRSS